MAAKSTKDYPYKVEGFFQHGSPFKTKGKSGTYSQIISSNKGIESARETKGFFLTLGGIAVKIIDRSTKLEIQ